MSNAIEEPNSRASLRQRAAEKLIVGIPATSKRASQSEALAVLHQLASSPSTASDALALLHELQVYQVELDLQREELGRSRSELESALNRQTALVERAPAGYMTIDAGTMLCAINLAGVRLLGAARDDLLGQPLSGLLSAPSAGVLQTLLARARDGLDPKTCELHLRPLAGVVRVVNAAVDKDPASEHFTLVLMAAASPGGET